jgi:hypothetical protein
MENHMKEIHLKHLNGQPVFRIGLFENQEFVDFRVMGRFSLMDGDDNELVRKIDSDLKWRIKIKESRPGKERFYLVLYESFNKEQVEGK